ncbi:MAG: Paraquat-inducible membrane protein A [uncultured Thiotrichaceae bacterium]|uniref:Paraquat-inducible membrane protein A n=1 Tax=uncultured Thiotrichaceae bacterium TaxID=298394 RepID=A0A6S6SJE3_9GAMM|nr:MAG: Paraquat-inducible membrane protein A [uncultured Thiotrichaceae bacterium]
MGAIINNADANNPNKKKFSLFLRNLYQGITIDLLLIAALITLVVGISAPLMTLEKLYFFENKVSLLSAVRQLFDKEEWALFIIIGLFSLCLPFVKIFSLMAILHIPHQGNSFLDKLLQWIEHWGKWSMLDVFVVALLLVSVKLGALAKVTVHYGLYTFACAVILTMITSFWIDRLAKKRDNKSITDPLE